MKNKFLLTLLFVVALGFTSVAQSISIGPRVGATFAKVALSEEEDGISNDDIKSNPGMQFGAVANFMINDMFSVQPELLYVQKGFKIGDDDMHIKGRPNYLEVPVLAKVSFGTEQLHGFATGGPSIGYWASGENSMKMGDSEASESYEFDDTDNRLELGASFGIGAAYKMGQGELNLDVRYGLGFTSLYEAEDGEAKTRNRVFGVSLAYLFSL
ncbi:porin family protein [Pontibacter anaerobius]|uniref:Porin family protein n=1 Tax=Pontibacter anaerobius TaxID=2993940 RepID=A0ABT3RGZ2_9BACT|nr:porin family protein [Pontibacter anaerobius]MCX2741101.1 porin family protein [Pontibacter anaerobius]